MSDAPPEGAPPSYAQATGSSAAPSKPTRDPSHLQVPQARNGIPAAHRRSMEDESRPLPKGWIRQFDEQEQHQYFVDTRSDPPRSTWVHPYDDLHYLNTLSQAEREKIQEEEHARLLPDLDNMSASSVEGYTPAMPPKSDMSGDAKKSGASSFGRKLKDKVTGSTHEERQAMRAKRDEEERQYYEAHMQFRRALQRAQMTGEPQLLGQDKDGKDVYIEPPGGVGRGYGGGGYGYNPYQSGPYANPNARFIRPPQPYARPYGGGYGGGFGAPLAGGMLGGLMLGGMMGGMGGGFGGGL